VVEIAGAFGWGDGGEEAADGRPELLLGPRRGLAQQRLELGEQLLDRVEVGRVRRQVEERGAGRGDRLADAIDLVRREMSSTTTSPGASAGARNCST
jgi:predicted GNAT family N-acyltransferase